MSQKSTNTTTGTGNINRNQNARRGGRGQGGSDGKGRDSRGGDCKNSSIAKYSFEGGEIWLSFQTHHYQKRT